MLEKDSHPPISLEVEDDEGDEVESLVEKVQTKERVDDNRDRRARKISPKR